MEYLWVILTLIAAVTLAVSDLLVKKVVTTGNELTVIWLRYLLALPVLLAGGLFVKMPVPDDQFAVAFLVALPLEVVAMVLYVKALKWSPMGLTIPFLSMTPVFMILFSFVILNEPLTTQGMAGIVLIAGGAYVLNVHTSGAGLFEPFKMIFRERGSLAMIGVAFIYSFTSSLGKIAVLHSSPLFFAESYFLAVTLCFAVLRARYERPFKARYFTRIEWFIVTLSGVTFGCMIGAHMYAISMTEAAYMVAVKRTSILFAVLFGAVFLKERRTLQRMVGAVLMVAGFCVIVLSK